MSIPEVSLMVGLSRPAVEYHIRLGHVPGPTEKLAGHAGLYYAPETVQHVVQHFQAHPSTHKAKWADRRQHGWYATRDVAETAGMDTATLKRLVAQGAVPPPSPITRYYDQAEFDAAVAAAKESRGIDEIKKETK